MRILQRLYPLQRIPVQCSEVCLRGITTESYVIRIRRKKLRYKGSPSGFYLGTHYIPDDISGTVLGFGLDYPLIFQATRRNQFPFSTWLPLALAGDIHEAKLKKRDAELIRTKPLVILRPVGTPSETCLELASRWGRHKGVTILTYPDGINKGLLLDALDEAMEGLMS